MLQRILLIVTYFKAVIHLYYFLKHCQIVGNLSLYASTSYNQESLQKYCSAKNVTLRIEFILPLFPDAGI